MRVLISRVKCVGVFTFTCHDTALFFCMPATMDARAILFMERLEDVCTLSPWSMDKRERGTLSVLVPKPRGWAENIFSFFSKERMEEFKTFYYVSTVFLFAGRYCTYLLYLAWVRQKKIIVL